ncbi:unnamed protein product [Cuscuta campestris]|uniref:Reverse transcriptase domain-containing protein n=1 Tax=Cuscuta campestris TaxID=132261 RepID=A0A484LD68_9ASTE|nr:unnamed protein product [Cuscuta campestris]
MAALTPNREVVVEDATGEPSGGKAGPAGLGGKKKKKIWRSQKKKATQPNGKAIMEDELSRAIGSGGLGVRNLPRPPVYGVHHPYRGRGGKRKSASVPVVLCQGNQDPDTIRRKCQHDLFRDTEGRRASQSGASGGGRRSFPRSSQAGAKGEGDMPGVDPRIICHRLAVDPAHKPVKQKKRFFSSERRDFVTKQVTTLQSIGHIREVRYPEWLANVVLASQGNTWRMCVDYTDLNKACPMDPFPLPNIDQLVDEMAGCELMSFMDAFSGYHQIRMATADEEKTSFITPNGVYFIR